MDFREREVDLSHVVSPQQSVHTLTPKKTDVPTQAHLSELYSDDLICGA